MNSTGRLPPRRLTKAISGSKLFALGFGTIIGVGACAGVAMVHVHARDPGNLPAPARTTGIWLEVNRKIPERCPDIIIKDTTGAGSR